MSDDNHVTVEVSMHRDLFDSIDAGRGVPPRSLRLRAEQTPDVSADSGSDSVNYVLEGAVAKFADNQAPTE